MTKTLEQSTSMKFASISTVFICECVRTFSFPWYFDSSISVSRRRISRFWTAKLDLACRNRMGADFEIICIFESYKKSLNTHTPHYTAHTRHHVVHHIQHGTQHALCNRIQDLQHTVLNTEREHTTKHIRHNKTQSTQHTTPATHIPTCKLVRYM